MKYGQKPQKVLKAENLELVQRIIVQERGVETFTPLLRLLAEVFDDAINGENVYVTTGMGYYGDRLHLTITNGEDKTRLYGANIKELSDAVRKFVSEA